MSKYINMAGQRFGNLLVLAKHPRRGVSGAASWVCLCDCGRRLIVRADNLRSGRSRRCSACRGHIGFPSVFISEGGDGT